MPPCHARVSRGCGAQVTVHPQINVDGKEEDELAELTRAAIASAL